MFLKKQINDFSPTISKELELGEFRQLPNEYSYDFHMSLVGCGKRVELSPHIHNIRTYVLVTEGEGRVIYGKNQFMEIREGNLITIEPNEVHSFIGLGDVGFRGLAFHEGEITFELKDFKGEGPGIEVFNLFENRVVELSKNGFRVSLSQESQTFHNVSFVKGLRDIPEVEISVGDEKVYLKSEEVILLKKGRVETLNDSKIFILERNK